MIIVILNSNFVKNKIFLIICTHTHTHIYIYIYIYIYIHRYVITSRVIARFESVGDAVAGFFNEPSIVRFRPGEGREGQVIEERILQFG